MVELRNRKDTEAKGRIPVANGRPKIARVVSQDRVDRGRARSGLEIPRKILHSSMSFGVIATWLAHPSVPNVIRLAFLGTLIIVTADLLRFRYPKFELFYENVLGYFMRESERDRVNGTVFYLVGVMWCLTFYPRDIAALSVVMLSLCDTSASVFGRLFGKYGPKLPFSGSLFGAKKSSAGTAAAVIVGYAASYVFWSRYATRGDEGDCSWLMARQMSNWKGPINTQPTPFPRLPNPNSSMSLQTLSLLNGCAAGLAEAFDLWGLDDNLTLPVLFGFFCWVTMWFVR